MIKNIVLDMGNVLIKYDPEIPLNKFLKCEEDRAIIRKELFEGPEWIQRDKGLISEEEMFERVSKRVPDRLHEGLRHCNYEWPDCMTPMKEARKFCSYVREQGYGLYVLSNAADNFYSYFTRFAPKEFFDGIVFSAEVHMIKPDVRIYRHLLDTYQLDGETCLFIDDREDNVQGAQEAGMQAAVYRDNFEEIKKIYKL